MPPGRPKKPDTKKYLVSLTDGTIKKTDAAAGRLKVSRSQVVEDALAAYHASNARPRKPKP